MPLLDIATTQPCFRNNVCSVSSPTIFGTTLVHNNKDIRFLSSCNSFRLPHKPPNSRIKLFKGGLTIRAVATLEKEHTKNNEEQKDFGGVRTGKYSTSTVAEHQSPSEENPELDEREKLRRMRISKANKGNTPWNKGRKHTPETLQRIRERTRLAMQDPKVMSCKHNFVNVLVKHEDVIKEREPQMTPVIAHYRYGATISTTYRDIKEYNVNCGGEKKAYDRKQIGNNIPCQGEIALSFFGRQMCFVIIMLAVTHSRVDEVTIESMLLIPLPL